MELIRKEIQGDEIKPFFNLLVKCGEHMYTQYKLDHWYPYFDEETFVIKMKDKKLYGVYREGIPIATFNVSTQPRDYYFDSLWNFSVENALYLGQLAIEPSLQGMGIGKWCMEQVEIIARELACDAVRFDAIELHPWLKNFYMRLGFSPSNTVKPGNWNLLCFEKRLDSVKRHTS